MSWSAVKLGDVCIDGGIQTGPFGSQLHQSDYSDEGTPVVMPVDLADGGISTERIARVSDDHVQRLSRHMLEPGDVVYARRGDVGRCSRVTESEKGWLCGTGCLRLRADSNLVDKTFLYYALSNPSVVGWVRNHAIGATMPNLNTTILGDVPLYIPDNLEDQRRIASILMAYDNLIENNRKQISLLEEAAQRLYKEWFVDLRFPGHEDIKIVDGIPYGWQIVQIRHVCKKIQSGGTPSRKKASFWNPGTVKWFKTGELQDCWLIEPEELISDDGLAGSAAKLFPPLTIVMAIYASPTLGRLGVLNCEAAFNQAMLGFIVNEDVTTRDWLYWKLFELRTEFNLIARGAGQQNISGEIVKSYEVLLPPRVLAQKFSDVVGPMAERRLKLQEHNLTVSEARDRLLPKLMSGEIEVEG